MNQLELIWELENHNNILDNLEKELNHIINASEAKSLQNKVIDLESEIKPLQESLEICQTQIRKKESKLKDDNFNIKAIEKDLYDGNIADLKQLEYLNEEKNNLSNIINDNETEILMIMEEAETLQNKLKRIEKQLIEVKEKQNKVSKRDLVQKAKLEESINLKKERIEEIGDKIEAKFLKRYNVLRGNRASGIVKVIQYICQGCNMRVPTYLGEPLKNKNEIIYCESCGRILYYWDVQKEKS